jgi:hypothetical protein
MACLACSLPDIAARTPRGLCSRVRPVRGHGGLRHKRALRCTSAAVECHAAAERCDAVEHRACTRARGGRACTVTVNDLAAIQAQTQTLSAVAGTCACDVGTCTRAVASGLARRTGVSAVRTNAWARCA